MAVTRKSPVETIFYMLLIPFVLVLCSYPVLSTAQGNSGNANGSQVGAQKNQSQDQDQQQDRDQDRIQDPATHDEPDQNQDREQERQQDRLHATSADTGSTIPQQDRDRDRIQEQIIYDDHQAIPVRMQGRVTNQEQLEAVIVQTRTQLQEQEKNLSQSVQNIHRNQNQVRVAAAALASSSSMLGPLGPAVNRIATDYKASVQTTIAAEERIQNRSRINSFLFGGDDDAVVELDRQHQQHELRIQELNRLVNAWEGDPAVKDILQEQIRVMEREQVRLQKVADTESSSRGLFDYLLFWRN